MISVVNLSKSYGSEQILNGVNLNFNSGKVYGVVGKNGAGKTTLFRCMVGMERCEGNVNCSQGVLKNIAGYLTTDPYFLSHITGKEYLQLMANAREVEIEDWDQQNIFDLPLNRFASDYSTGMKKKLALTGLLVQKNQVFVLDEPFNGVDVESNLMINSVIKKLKELNKTIILSSHIFSTLRDNCDELYLLKEGCVSEPIEPMNFDKVEEELIGNVKVLDNLGW